MTHKQLDHPEFDPQAYRHHLDSMDISEEDAHQLLAALWHIMQTFVDIGWGVDSVQQIFPEIFNGASQSEQDSLDQTSQSHNDITHQQKGQ